jgi:hypothetical protein
VDTLDEDFASGLFDDRTPPCISLYQPTSRHHPSNQQDPIRFGNLLKTLEASLRNHYPEDETRTLLEPFHALAADTDFWQHTLDGLAVLSAPGVFRTYRLQRPVAELAVAADSFHTKPLLRILQSADRYHILGLSRQGMRLFEGNRDAVDEIEPFPGVPRTLTDALGDELTEPRHTVSSYGGTGQSGMHHGHGGRKAEVDKDAERYFRAVDRTVHEQHSKPSGLPLILAALPEHHHLFHSISHNPQLLPESIDVNPDSLESTDELRRRAWQVLEPRYLERLASLVESFGQARSTGLGDADLAQVGRSVVAGRVATMLIEARREVPGRVDAQTGDITFGDIHDPNVDDILDDLGELTLKAGGEVVIVPGERMPTDTGVAAIYRY